MEGIRLVARLEGLAMQAHHAPETIDRHELCLLLVDLESWHEVVFGACPAPDVLMALEPACHTLREMLELSANHVRRAFLAHNLGNVTHGTLRQSLRCAMCHLWNAVVAISQAQRETPLAQAMRVA
ncbi:MAG: hypothetical protein KIS92_11795 [Planctomycetota bacterium]|nr:hypothetical protein [Planctomycetota bacterium]